jgi:hypothetical protein
MLHQFPDYSLIRMNQNNGNQWVGMDSGIEELTETISPESSQDPGPSLNILPFKGRPLHISEGHVRSVTYVLLGMTLGIVIVALFIDVSAKSKTSLPIVPAQVEQETQEQATHEQNSAGTE